MSSFTLGSWARESRAHLVLAEQDEIRCAQPLVQPWLWLDGVVGVGQDLKINIVVHSDPIIIAHETRILNSKSNQVSTSTTTKSSDFVGFPLLSFFHFFVFFCGEWGLVPDLLGEHFRTSSFKAKVRMAVVLVIWLKIWLKNKQTCFCCRLTRRKTPTYVFAAEDVERVPQSKGGNCVSCWLNRSSTVVHLLLNLL